MMQNQYGGVRDGAGSPTAAQKAAAVAQQNIRNDKQSTLSFAHIRPPEEPPTVDLPVTNNEPPAPTEDPPSNDDDPPAPAWQAEVNTQQAHNCTGINFASIAKIRKGQETGEAL